MPNQENKEWWSAALADFLYGIEGRFFIYDEFDRFCFYLAKVAAKRERERIEGIVKGYGLITNEKDWREADWRQQETIEHILTRIKKS